MKTLKCEIEFFGYWHIGSGLSVAGDVDAAVLKNKEGLPYIPGKTLKGLFRDAAEKLNAFEADQHRRLLDEIFGKQTTPDEDPENHQGQGLAYFGNAELGAVIEDKSLLYDKISATAINAQTGVAEDHTLRKYEVCIPLKLFAEIEVQNSEQQDFLQRCAKMVKRMGVLRHRGLGRCQVRFV
jgi:CRISPR/Cas system CSM-associated protein Csm3 (group 7 of RAMP superfamily)